MNPGSEEANKALVFSVQIFLTFVCQMYFQNFTRSCGFTLVNYLKYVLHLWHMTELLEVDVLKNLSHVLT